MKNFLKNKRAGILHQAVIQIILIGLIFGLFFAAINLMVQSRDVKQGLLERQVALIIDSASPGMEISVYKKNANGYINNLEIKENRVYVYVEGAPYSNGYPYFTEYNLKIEDVGRTFIIKVEK